MFREMRRKNQALDAQACGAILDRGTSGVLAVSYTHLDVYKRQVSERYQPLKSMASPVVLCSSM